ncbi:hypothetical protein GCM10023229_16860 [Flavisolibacter ginsenosidimutans]
MQYCARVFIAGDNSNSTKHSEVFMNRTVEKIERRKAVNSLFNRITEPQNGASQQKFNSSKGAGS